MKARRLVLLGILGSGPLTMLLAWPLVADQLRLADLTVAVVAQPQAEVFVIGYLKNANASAFAIETLSIEEPGKEAYRRLVSLNAEGTFELALGRPLAGTYRVAAWTRKQTWLKGLQENWLRTPELVVKTDSALQPQRVRAQDFDNERMLLFGSLIVAMQAASLIAWYRLPRLARAPGSNESV